MKRLMEILKMARPHGSEDKVAARFLAPYEPEVLLDTVGEVLGWLVTVGVTETLFCAHLDTAESTVTPHKLKLNRTTLKTDGKSILGADDGAGVWLLLEMIDAGVPGAYLFTVGEERGGVGAKGVAKLYTDWLSLFKRAVCFDRRGIDSVITHQGTRWCCSNEFAEDLADRLNELLPNGFYSPDSSGVYTDCAEFVDAIPNCTNISCGYQFEHSCSESLNLTHLSALREAVLMLDWEALDQTPCPYEAPWLQWSQPRYGSARTKTTDLYQMDYDEIVEFVYRNDPEDVAVAIHDALWGVTEKVESHQGSHHESYIEFEDERLHVGMY